MRRDRGGQLRPYRAWEVMAHALHHHQLRLGACSGGGAPTGRCYQWVGTAVDDECWRGDCAQLCGAVARGDDRRELTSRTGRIVVAFVASECNRPQVLLVAR